MVQPKLVTVAGVQRADILGAGTFAMRVWLKPDRMAALQVTASDVSNALQSNNVLSAVGSTKGQMVAIDMTARTDLRSPEEFRQLVIREEGAARRYGPRPSTSAGQVDPRASLYSYHLNRPQNAAGDPTKWYGVGPRVKTPGGADLLVPAGRWLRLILEVKLNTVTNGRGNPEITRFKGLGEMMPKVLWETTLNPKTRRLLRVEVSDQIVTDRVINELMGKDPSARFRFIMERAEDAEELDV